MRKELIQNVSVPEDLVQVQAYIRWERKGKQMYTPEQEKVNAKHVLSSCFMFFLLFGLHAQFNAPEVVLSLLIGFVDILNIIQLNYLFSMSRTSSMQGLLVFNM